MSKTVYTAEALTGGGANALDFIDGAGLLDGDYALVFASNVAYFYILDDDSGAAESSPDIILPDANAGNKRWLLQATHAASTSRVGGVELLTAAEILAMTDSNRAVTANLLPQLLYSVFHRSQFVYNDADQIDCGAAMYMCKDKLAQWVSTITTVATGAAGGADWWYLYLDYSAITSGTAITNSELIWSTTEPSFNTTYRQWMNGDDRCIFAVRTDGSNNILEFFHIGDQVIFADRIVDLDGVDIDTTWTDVTLTIPGFTTLALTTMWAGAGDQDVSLLWRTNGQSGTTAHLISSALAAAHQNIFNTLPAITDSSQTIEVKNSVSGTNTASVSTDGWKFPIGI